MPNIPRGEAELASPVNGYGRLDERIKSNTEAIHDLNTWKNGTDGSSGAVKDIHDLKTYTASMQRLQWIIITLMAGGLAVQLGKLIWGAK